MEDIFQEKQIYTYSQESITIHERKYLKRLCSLSERVKQNLFQKVNKCCHLMHIDNISNEQHLMTSELNDYLIITEMMKLTFSTPFYILSFISRQHGYRITSVGHLERPRDLVEHVEPELKLKTEI